MPIIIRQVGVGLVVVLLQWLIFGRLKLWGAFPDIVLLYVAYIAIRYGRLPGAAAGFFTGFLMDAINQTWGLHMLVKTIMGFVVGLFRSEQGETLRLNPIQAAVGALVVALVHNGVFVILLALDEGMRTPMLITALWLGSALYTAVVAMLGTLIRSR
ncbi:rod shape-determining protein MreD [soil metagenome]